MSLLAKAVKKCVARDMSSQDFVTSVKNMYREGDTFGGERRRVKEILRRRESPKTTSNRRRRTFDRTHRRPRRRRHGPAAMPIWKAERDQLRAEQQEAQWRQGQEVQNLILVYTYHQYDPMMSFKEMLLCCVVLFACLLGPAGAGEGATPTCGDEYHEKMEDSKCCGAHTRDMAKGEFRASIYGRRLGDPRVPAVEAALKPLIPLADDLMREEAEPRRCRVFATGVKAFCERKARELNESDVLRRANAELAAAPGCAGLSLVAFAHHCNSIPSDCTSSAFSLLELRVRDSEGPPAAPVAMVAPAAQVMDVDVPAYAAPGSTLAVAAPDGRVANVVVPEGATPGTKIRVAIY